MNITVTKNSRGVPTVNIELTKRGFELLVGLIGGSSGATKVEIINRSMVVIDSGKLTDFSEVSEVFDYLELSETLSNEVYPNIVKVVEFVYDKRDGSVPTWRNLHVTSEVGDYIEGLENGNTFKKFLKSRIVGGRILTTA